MRTLIWDLLSCSLIMTALSLVFGLLCRALRGRYAAKWRYYGWLVLLIGYLFPFRPPVRHALVTVSPPAPPAALPAAGAAASDALDPMLLVVIAWIGGAVLVLARTLYRHAAFCRLVRRCAVPVTGGDAFDAARELCGRLGIRKAVPLLRCSCVSSPMVIGLFRPRILLPCQEYSAAEWRLILHHELIHYKRKDILFKIILAVCRAVHWFNPFLYPISRMIGRECEIACDEAVVRNASEETKKRYCQAILSVVTYGVMPATAFSSHFAGGKMVLKRRLAEILATGRKRSFVLIAVLLGAAVALSGMLFRVEAGGSDQPPAPEPSLQSEPQTADGAAAESFSTETADYSTTSLYTTTTRHTRTTAWIRSTQGPSSYTAITQPASVPTTVTRPTEEYTTYVYFPE